MPHPAEQTCEKCLYYCPLDGQEGECRRRAPVASDGAWAWPVILRLEWCGEWAPTSRNGGEPCASSS